MNTRNLAIVLLIPFTALSIQALIDVGYVGVLQHQMQNSAGVQVFVDLAIALTLILTWMIPEAKRKGRNPWPWVVVTLIAGSFGPLLYLATNNDGA